MISTVSFNKESDVLIHFRPEYRLLVPVSNGLKSGNEECSCKKILPDGKEVMSPLVIAMKRVIGTSTVLVQVVMAMQRIEVLKCGIGKRQIR